MNLKEEDLREEWEREEMLDREAEAAYWRKHNASESNCFVVFVIGLLFAGSVVGLPLWAVLT